VNIPIHGLLRLRVHGIYKSREHSVRIGDAALSSFGAVIGGQAGTVEHKKETANHATMCDTDHSTPVSMPLSFLPMLIYSYQWKEGARKGSRKTPHPRVRTVEVQIQVSVYIATEKEKTHVPNASQSWLGHCSLVSRALARTARSYGDRLGAQPPDCSESNKCKCVYCR
jgi:hypothetical protein